MPGMARSMTPELPAVGVSSSVMTREGRPAFRDRQPVARHGGGGDADGEIAVGAAQGRPGVEARRHVRVRARQRVAVAVSRMQRPQAGGGRYAGDLVAAVRDQPAVVAVGGGGEGEALRAAEQQPAVARPMGFRTGRRRPSVRRERPSTARARWRRSRPSRAAHRPGSGCRGRRRRRALWR